MHCRVVVGYEVVRALRLPFDLVIVQKIGYPLDTEHTIAALAEDGELLCSTGDMEDVDYHYLENETYRVRKEIRRRRERYFSNRPHKNVTGKTAIIVMCLTDSLLY
ncbi:MAG: hypothetical protein Q8P93_00515 [bacterium]|nr:hypothetical protein [bacterium]